MLIGIGMSLMAGLKSSASPASLFANGEVGVWYDPSSVANLAWRYNLLTYTEQFDNAAWVKTNTTVTANAAVAPDGTTTADKLSETATTASHYAYQTYTSTGVSVVSSVYAKAAERRRIAVWEGTTSANGAVFDLISGTVVNNLAAGVGSIQSVGDGWYRCSVTSTETAGTRWLVCSVLLDNATGVGGTVGVAGSGLYVWGAQLELGSTVTAYQMITDVVTQTIANCPNNTLYQDNAGTTPVTAAGQTVGLMLDKSQGLVLGSELVTNGTFDSNTTGWTANNLAVLSSSGGELLITASPIWGSATQSVTLVAGKSYLVSVTMRRGTASNAQLLLAGASIITTSTTNVTLTKLIVPSVTSNTLQLYCDAASGGTAFFDNVSIKLLAGNHATQPTSTQRPTYGINPIVGTRNLLTYTEQFDNAAWAKSQATVSADTAVAPDGTTTADSILDTAVSNIHYIAQNITSLAPSGKTYTMSAYAKANTLNFMTLGISDISSGTLYAVAVFNLSTGAVSTSRAAGTGYSVVSSSISSVGNGWYRCVVTVVAGTSVTFLRSVLAPNKTGVIPADAGGYESYLGNGSSFYAWGAQLEQSATATAYQKVVSQYEVTQAGVQSVSYLAFDGVDDGMATNTITPGIDKVQVFAGVRKLSDAAIGVIAELGTGSGNGLFFLAGSRSATGDYGFFSKGTVGVDAQTPNLFSAPITNILTGLGDISGDISRIRVNGGNQVTTTTDQGTGNYLAYPLYLGRRGGTTLPYNGRLYSLITRFGANLTDGQVTATETWVNGETGAMTWILTQGTWYDDGQWYDTATWNDGV